MMRKTMMSWLAVSMVLGSCSALAESAYLVERGRYLTDAGNCFSCHTTAEGEPYAGGVAFLTPFGKLYSTNITPDPDTGIGRWSAADLRRAMHEGIAPDGRRLFPAFPYPSYTRVSDADVDAIHAYLQTLPAVKYRPPKNDLAFRMRWPMRLWNALFFKPERYRNDAQQSAEWNRGAYLVEGLGHCGACHTPRNAAMAEIPERALQGGVLLDRVDEEQHRPWSAVDLTPASHALGAWSVDELTRYLHTGFSRRAGVFGPMNEVIVNSLRKLDAADVRAMAVYLQALPASEPVGDNVPPEMAQAGADIYKEHCAECHGPAGRGGIFSGPPLAGSAIVQSAHPASLINVILYGPQAPKEITLGSWETMPAYADRLTDEQIVALGNFLRGSWENKGAPLQLQDVTRQR